MSNDYEQGRVVWHDLLSNDVDAATRFYKDLLGWSFEIEHTPDFVWKAGEADYPLIMVNGEAHGGFVDVGPEVRPQWLTFVAAHDVDAVTAKARDLGARIDREPFDVPGVGRASVIEDPEGAVICPYARNHQFPAPGGAFLWDELVTGNTESAARFYGELFSWTAEACAGPTGKGKVFKNANGDAVAGIVEEPAISDCSSTWLPYLATRNLHNAVVSARALGATLQLSATDVATGAQSATFIDPGGARFGLLATGKPTG